MDIQYWKMFQDQDEDTIGFNQYQILAQRTSATNGKMDKILNGLLGLNGEAGEAIDVLKKYYYQGHELNEDKLFDEAGDILWYIAELMTGLGKTMDDLARHNIDKLVGRYPEGFEKEKSIYREQEEKIVSE